MKMQSKHEKSTEVSLAFDRSWSENSRSRVDRKLGAFILSFIMMAGAFAGFTQAVGTTTLTLSDRIVLFDDFEDSGSGGFDWAVIETPPSFIQPFNGLNSPGQFDYQGEWSLNMNADKYVPSHAYAVSPSFFLEPETDYLVSLDLMISSSVSSPYNGWFTVVDDGNFWLIIDGEYDGEHGSLTTAGRKGQVLPPLTPLLYDKWYYVECRVHILDEEYDVYVNGEFQATIGFDHGNSSVTAGF
jgi:hypothetical protein